MSETEDLKKATDESKHRQQMQAVSDYLDKISAEIDVKEKAHKISSVAYMIAWVCWMAAAFAPDWVHTIATTMFIVVLIYDQFRFSRLMSSYSELHGAIHTLRLLGYLPPRDEDGEKKKRRVVSEFVEMVKQWAITKQKAKETVYAPA